MLWKMKHVSDQLNMNHTFLEHMGTYIAGILWVEAGPFVQTASLVDERRILVVIIQNCYGEGGGAG